MINVMVRGMLGQWGQAVLNFYQQNSVWINAIIFIYFIIVILAQQNYKQTVVGLITSISEKNPEILEKKTAKEIARILEKKGIPWDAVINISKWPFIATPRQLYPHLRNEGTLKKLITADVLANEIHKRVNPSAIDSKK